MTNKYDASSTFDFTDGTGTYHYDGKTGLVTGGDIGEPIKFMKVRVEASLRNGAWKVVERKEFPRPGVHAKCEKMKVFVVGRSSQGTSAWIVETATGSMMRVHLSKLSMVDTVDEQAFAMSKDLAISYDQAIRMINKGYGKV